MRGARRLPTQRTAWQTPEQECLQVSTYGGECPRGARASVEQYIKVAKTAIEADKDGSGVQQLRVQALEIILSRMGK